MALQCLSIEVEVSMAKMILIVFMLEYMVVVAAI